ncbi:interleukin-31 receptor subunit alpha [Sebastes fasciatus]|uniref:interleukin-31 receptor subunit alpha n=1 Tax=Sebastes fasciatus TaxID=394691 RepID=UPI003D9DF426
MVGRGFHFDFLDLKCSSSASHSHLFILGLLLVYYKILSACVQASDRVKCGSQNISSRYHHCGIHLDGVHDLDCFGKHSSLRKVCVWKPGKRTSEKIYTLITQQQHRGRNHCGAYYNITGVSEEITISESSDVTVEVFENSQSINCTKAVFSASPKSFLRCGPPDKVIFSRHSGRLAVNVIWPELDKNTIQYYSVKYIEQGNLTQNQSLVQSYNGVNCTISNCTVEDLKSSLVYSVQIRCVPNDKCSQCPWSENYTVPSELTTQPVIVVHEDTDLAERKGRWLLYLTWKFPAKELHDGFYVTVGKASGEAPYERMNTSQPEIRLILSSSAYHLTIRAVNNASTSPALNLSIPQRQDMTSMGAGKLNVTVHSNTSFTIYWKDNLIKNYVCYSVEWTKEGHEKKGHEKKGHEAVYMSFYQDVNNYRTLSPLPEPLEPYERYSITLHTRPNKETCNMEHVNNSEITYGRTQFYFTEGSPISAPINISSYNVMLNSVMLQWSSIPEEDVRGFLLGYIIYYTEYHHDGTSTERNITVDPTLNSYELGDLKGGTAYEVQISGFTQAGAGVRSTANLFKTDDQGFSNLSGVIAIVAVVATVLIFGPPIIKRAKGILWPSIPNPGNSNAMQKIEEPCVRELLESIHTLKVEEWDTNSLQIVEKEDAASTLPSMVPLLCASEDEADSPEMTRNWIQRETEDATGDIPPNITAETLPDIQQTDPRSSPLAFPSGYTTMEMFQQGMPQGVPADASVTQATESDPEDTDSTVVKSGLDYIGQFSTSPISDSEEMSAIL